VSDGTKPADAEEDDPCPNATPWLRMKISPEPTADEGEALIAAISAYAAAQAKPPVTEQAPPASHWSAVGRHEAVRGKKGAPPMGWGRQRIGWS
jgi:hypothetical protein